MNSLTQTTNPFNAVTHAWEHEQWDRLQGIDTASDENEDKDFGFDELDDYVIRRMLDNTLSPSANSRLAQDMMQRLDDLVAKKPEWKDMPEWSWEQTKFYDQYFETQLEAMGEEAFKQKMEATANLVIPNTILRHDVNGPNTPKKLKRANYQFDHWSHHYITSNGNLSPDMNHSELDKYVLVHLGIHPNVVAHQGWLRKYANAMYVSYLNGELSVSINTRTTIEQERKVYQIAQDVLDRGGKFFWSYNAEKLNEGNFSVQGNSLQSLLWFMDDKAKGKIDTTGAKYE